MFAAANQGSSGQQPFTSRLQRLLYLTLWVGVVYLAIDNGLSALYRLWADEGAPLPCALDNEVRV